MSEEEFQLTLQQQMPPLGPGPFDFLKMSGPAGPMEVLAGRTPRDLKPSFFHSQTQSQLYVRM